MPQEIAEDTKKSLSAASPLAQIDIWCINMDAGTSDDNIFAMFAVIHRYRRYGA